MAKIRSRRRFTFLSTLMLYMPSRGGSEMAKTCWLHPDRQRPITQLSGAALCSVSKSCHPAVFLPLERSGAGKGSRLYKENNEPADTGSFHFMGNSDLLKFLSIPITNKPQIDLFNPILPKISKKSHQTAELQDKNLFAVINFI